MKTKKLKIGAWYAVDLGHIDQKHIDEIKEAGIDLIFAGWGTDAEKKEILRLCSNAGVDVLVNDTRISQAAPDAEAYAKIIAEYKDEPSFAGNMFADEPGAGAYPIFGQRIKAYKSIAPDKIAYVNLLPNYAPLSACQTETYEEYVEKFAEFIDEDYISVDIYPLSIDDKGVKHTSGIYFRNLDQVATVCRRTGRDFWGFIQSMSFNGAMREPTEDELRYQCYAYMAFGANGIFHFCYATPPSGAESFPMGMIDKDAEKTVLWYRAKNMDAELAALSPVYMRYRNLGARTLYAGRPSNPIDFDNQFDPAKVPVVLDIETTQNALVGYFADDRDRNALILLNCAEIQEKLANDITLTLDVQDITVYRRGLPTRIHAENGVFSLRLDNCEGVFVTIG